MSLTNPQDLTTRILNPNSNRSKNGGAIKSSSSTTNRAVHFPAEAHLPHQETGASQATHSQPIVSGTGFQGIPPPSTLFRTTMASWRHNQQHHPHINVDGNPTVPHVNENLPPQNNPQSVASIPRMTAVSKNKAREHSRQLSQLSRLQQSRSPSHGAVTKKSASSSSSSTPSWRRNPISRIIDSLKRSPDPSSSMNAVPNHDPDIVLEFDRDISEFLVSVSGSFLGMNPNELMQSNGLRQLIARNMRWFQNTPDWMKVVGLLVAKKFNGEVRNRNALLEAFTTNTNAYTPLSSSSSSSFISEGLNEEEVPEVKQPLLIRHSEPIPIPKAQQQHDNTTPEDHIQFMDDLFDNVVMVASTSSSSSSSSNDKIVQTKESITNVPIISPNETKKKDKKRKYIAVSDEIDDDSKKKQKEVSVKKEKPKKVSSSSKSLATPQNSTIDILDVDDVELNPCVKDNDSVTLMHLSN